jgi:hypothetical protein
VEKVRQAHDSDKLRAFVKIATDIILRNALGMS